MGLTVSDYNKIYALLRQLLEDRDQAQKESTQSATGEDDKQWYLVKITAVNSGSSPVTYNVTVWTGAPRAATNMTFDHIRVASASTNFSVGDFAIMLVHGAEAPVLASGGGAGGQAGAMLAHSHNSDMSGYTGFLSGLGY